jgi:uncharacterized phage-associated protein
MTELSEVVSYLTAYSTVRGETLSNQRLNRLLYYAQAWHLAIYDEELFTDGIEAWESGPVVPSVYEAFERIDKAILNNSPPSNTCRAHLDAVMERYFRMTDDQLDKMIRQEAPWIVARDRIPVDGRIVIRLDEMKLFYRYSSQDAVTKLAAFSCRMWATIQVAFNLSIHTALFYLWSFLTVATIVSRGRLFH